MISSNTRMVAVITAVLTFAASCGCATTPPPKPPTTTKPPIVDVKPPTTHLRTSDVLVVGSGPSAVAAAAAAAAYGAKVQIVTHDAPVLGGQTLSVGKMDIKGDDSDWGPYEEYIRRAKAEAPAMGFSASEIAKGWIPPELTVRTLTNWMNELNVRVVPDRVADVTRSGANVKGVKLESGGTITADVTVDASEWGDVLADSGVPFMLGDGRSDNGTLDSSDCLQDATWPVNMSTKSNKQSPYSPLPIIPNAYNGQTWNLASQHTGYREVAGVGSERRSQINHQTSDVPSNVRDATSTRNDLHQRAAYAGMRYAASVQSMSDGSVWGLDTGISDTSLYPLTTVSVSNESALSALPYIREGRRGVGVDILNSRDIRRVSLPDTDGYQDATQERSSIAVGNYSTDLHNCPAASDPTEPAPAIIQDGYTNDRRSGPYSIPFEVLVPATGDGLVFGEKVISTTRAVSGAVRIHPAAFSTGAASGLIAAIAAMENIKPRDVTVEKVQWLLASDWNADLTNRVWDDARPGTKEQAVMEYAAARGWVQGVRANTSGHGWRMRRGDAVELLARADGLSPRTSVFSDASGAEATWLAAAYHDGWFNGCATGVACADDLITDGQLAYLEKRMLGGSPTGGSDDAVRADVMRVASELLSAREHGRHPVPR